MTRASPPPAAPSASLETFLDLFRQLSEEGLSFVVIGGCAVGVYARHVGTVVVSQDLDLYMTEAGLEELLDASAQLGAIIEKRPRPRSLPVAVLRWRGVEINALTASGGLPPADVAMRSAREVTLETVPEPVLIADAGDLLRNKLTINRPKDASHIDILRHFMEEEAVAAFLTERESRARIAPTERLLAVVGARTLQASLGARLVAVAREPSDFRFLAHRLPSRGLVVALAARAPSTALRDLVEAIATRRNLT